MPQDRPPALTIPLSLTDSIIAHLRSDRPSLMACSLTCRAWTCPAQAYLFHHLQITSSAHAKAFDRLLESSPHLALYVRFLDIWQKAVKEEEEEGYVEAVIPHIIPQLFDVTKLRFWGVRFCDLSSGTLSSLPCNFPHLRALVFERCRFGACHDLVELLLGYSRVKRVWLDHVGWVRPVEGASADPTPWGPADKQLSLSCAMMRHVDRGLLGCLLSPDIGIRLNSVVLIANHSSPMTLDKPRSGDGIDSLWLGMELGINLVFDTADDLQDMIKDITLPSQSIIHSLRVKVDFAMEKPPSFMYDSWVCNALCELSSLPVQEVLFDISARNIKQLDRLDFKEVAKVLNGASFARLQRVTVSLDCVGGAGVHADDVKEEIARRMCELGERLLLADQ